MRAADFMSATAVVPCGGIRAFTARTSLTRTASADLVRMRSIGEDPIALGTQVAKDLRTALEDSPP